ncbi:L,D-transpeptidase family protein [Methylotuvimicrobium sp. KM2]|uniref:L,D-transpeptidase family protein n=1 Tax=Methylotuvimicrobium sp. KM2 TaxID=3133976 RepID=UPI003101AD94
MKQPLHKFLIALTIIALFLPKISTAEHLSVEESIRERIESAAEILDLSIDNQPLNSQKGLITFYSDRQFSKAWLANGQPTPQAYQLIHILNSADQHGLNKSNYHVTAINERLERLKAPLDESEVLILSVDLDLLLSDAFLTYGTHLIQGQVNPQKLQSKWDTGRRATDMVKILTDAINTNSIEQSLNELMPKQPGYRSLVRALADHHAIKDRGGWPSVTKGPSLRPDEKNPRIIELRKRLAASGDLVNDVALDNQEFDRSLQQAVKYFQKRHGLETDSIVGKATLAALNVSVDQRIAQIRANLERWRWLPDDLGARHIMVNIAGFELDFVGNGEVLLHMPVIVGKTYRETPVFTGSMTYLVINPSWYVPNSIAVKDKLPILVRDPYYIERNHMKLYRGWGANRTEINPLSVNWRQVDPNNFPFRLVQKPGPKNAMGKVKFMFPNPHNVYLHDTSEPSLFNRVDRTFSSGCIRVGKPFALANLVLENNSRMTPDAIREAFDQSDQKTVTLLNPIPVHILYWTAWVDLEGVVQFRRDIYNRDDELIQKLQKSF